MISYLPAIISASPVVIEKLSTNFTGEKDFFQILFFNEITETLAQVFSCKFWHRCFPVSFAKVFTLENICEWFFLYLCQFKLHLRFTISLAVLKYYKCMLFKRRKWHLETKKRQFRESSIEIVFKCNNFCIYHLWNYKFRLDLFISINPFMTEAAII